MASKVNIRGMFQQYKKIHFAGAGGIGISALIKWAILDGVAVSGSDAAQSDITEELNKMGAKIFIGHNKENVPPDADLIIYSDAVSESNAERCNKILQKSYFEALGDVTRQKKTLAISGTNGKSTTTAMLGKILIDAGFDPTVIVGSKINDFKYGNFHPGKSEWLVVEACEHNAHMLNLAPEYIVLTNIEADHLDFYKNLENILKNFEKYVSRIPKSGFLAYNADDKNTGRIAQKIAARKISYGTAGDFSFTDRFVKESAQFFNVLMEGKRMAEISLKIPGLFNVYNAMAAAAAAYSLGAPFDAIKKSLEKFSGLWRRFERVGEYNGAPVISDYGHHPTAVAATILAAREFFPERRVVVAFEPHQHHRTKALFADFVRSFDDADAVILSEIYNVAGRVKQGDRDISSKKLGEAIVKYWESGEDTRRERELILCNNLSETEDVLRKIVKKNDAVIIMGAGDIDKVARKICST